MSTVVDNGLHPGVGAEGISVRDDLLWCHWKPLMPPTGPSVRLPERDLNSPDTEFWIYSDWPCLPTDPQRR